MSNTLPVTSRTEFHRRAQRGTHDRESINAILDEAYVCHVGFATPTGPLVMPTTHVRIDDHVYVHGSVSNRMLRSLAEGTEISIAVTLLDGLVLGRTAFHHSVNYRSAMIFGRARLVENREDKLRVMTALIEHIMPGRSSACRAPNTSELDAILVLGLPIEEASAKVRTGPPFQESGDDATLPYWFGVVPIETARGTPINAPGCGVAFDRAVGPKPGE